MAPLGRGEPVVKSAAQPLSVELTLVPEPDAVRSWNSALDLLADWMAKEVLEQSRADAAAELGVAPGDIAPEPNDVPEVVRAHGERLLGASS